MRPVEEYTRQAIECARLAQKLSDLPDKALWLFMAEAWLWFADDAAKLPSTVATQRLQPLKAKEPASP